MRAKAAENSKGILHIIMPLNIITQGSMKYD